jgi:hypothetical protein
MYSSKAMLVMALGLVAGCSITPESGSQPDEIGESASALGYAANTDAGTRPPLGPGTIVAPTLANRRLVRMQTPGCTPVEGAGGVWNGASVASGDLSSTSFCAYAWASASKAPPDLGSLDAVAMFDGQRGLPYNVHDPRAANTPAEETSLATPYLSMTPSLGLTAGGEMRRSSGCGVCVSLEGNYLWLILPPEATWGAPIVLHAGNASYPLGAASAPAYYAPAPPGLSGALPLSW